MIKHNNILKVLLVKHGDKPLKQLKWKFPGGKLLKGYSLRSNAIREAQQEIGLKIKIIASLPTLGLWQAKPETSEHTPELIILVHYLAQIKGKPIKGKEILAMQWFDIQCPPPDCAPNIKPILKAAKNYIQKINSIHS